MDWQAGRITLAGAETDYGVILREGAVDEVATVACRAQRARRTGFDPGPARAAHEALWTEAAYEAMHAYLAQFPVSWRAPLKRRLFAAVRNDPERRSPLEILAEQAGRPG